MGVLIFVIFHTTDANDRHLKKNMGFTTGTIEDVTSLRGSPFQANYSFAVKDSTIHNRVSINVGNTGLHYLRMALTGQKLGVVYDTLDRSNNKLLLSLRDYNEFGLKPDSSVVKVFKRIDSLRIGKDATEQ
jgi:hypothetical protein